MARRPAALLAALALFLAAPAAALAQGAGDDQYSDPFGEEQAGGNGDEGSSGGDEGSSGGDSEAQEPAAPAPAAEPAPAPEATAAQEQPPAGEEQLAYTGAEEGLVALAGAVLLVGGVALRVRLSAPAPRRR